MEGTIFSKRLTKTDIKNRLCIPTGSLPMFPSFAGGNNVQSLIVIDQEEGNVLNLCLSVRRNLHPKPVAQGGWVQFAKRKGLKVGDEVEFLWVIDANGKVTYKIRLFRHYV